MGLGGRHWALTGARAPGNDRSRGLDLDRRLHKARSIPMVAVIPYVLKLGNVRLEIMSRRRAPCEP